MVLHIVTENSLNDSYFKDLVTNALLNTTSFSLVPLQVTVLTSSLDGEDYTITLLVNYFNQTQRNEIDSDLIQDYISTTQFDMNQVSTFCSEKQT